MKKSVFVTGLAGSGKSTICQKLGEMGYKSYDIEKIKGLFKMVDKETGEVIEGYDNDDLKKVKKGKWICDKEKLQEIMNSEKSEIAFYCGNASNYDDIISLFNKVVLLLVSPEVMGQRLSTRKRGGFGRTKEVQDWVMTWKDWWENDIRERGVITINADGSLEKIAKEVIETSKK